MMPNDRCDGAALVTGGGRGIGRAVSQALSRRGHFVFINYVEDEAAARDTLASIVAEGGTGEIVRGNVADSAQVAHMFEAIERHARPLEVLVNNAGVTDDALFLEVSEERLERLWATNLRGVLACTQRALPAMISRRYGRIVNVSSVLAAQPNRGVAAYAATKGALEAMTRAVAVEVAPRNVTVNAVAPGFIRTSMTAEYDREKGKTPFTFNAARRAGTPEEVAAAVAFLTARAASFITGQILAVNGGTAPLSFAGQLYS